MYIDSSIDCAQPKNATARDTGCEEGPICSWMYVQSDGAFTIYGAMKAISS